MTAHTAPESAPVLPARFFGLDALRGLAALAIVFWHWQHFFLLGQASTVIGPRGVEIDRTQAPLYGAFNLLYDHGGRAVDLFFVISGFIFFWLYERAIARRQMGPLRFAVLRFSRLYPLHLATLIAVAALLAVFAARTGQGFIYAHSDGAHFVQQLFFFNDPNAASFNGPTWSLTIEIVMYALFFVLARARLLAGLAAPAALVVVGMMLWPVSAVWARGLAGFFAGGVVFRLYVRARGSPRRRAWEHAALGAMALAVAATVIAAYAPPPWEAWTAHLPVAPYWAGFCAPRWLLCYLVLPLIVLTAALWEERARALFTRAAPLGDITYASYLLHFPLQLVFANFAVYGLLSPAIFRAPAMLAAFFALLIALSYATYAWFERPVQAWLRKALTAASSALVRQQSPAD